MIAISGGTNLLLIPQPVVAVIGLLKTKPYSFAALVQQALVPKGYRVVERINIDVFGDISDKSRLATTTTHNPLSASKTHWRRDVQ
jgi:hypothetical protein